MARTHKHIAVKRTENGKTEYRCHICNEPMAAPKPYKDQY